MNTPHTGMDAHVTRGIVVKKSSVPLDLVTFENVHSDPGLGAYQMVPGKYTFYVKHPTRIESIKRTRVHDCQVPYMMASGHDMDKVIVPTVESIRLRHVHYTFRVQHNKEKLQSY